MVGAQGDLKCEESAEGTVANPSEDSAAQHEKTTYEKGGRGSDTTDVPRVPIGVVASIRRLYE